MNDYFDKKGLEFKERLRLEKEKYEIEKKMFYSNPIHWNNNKRKIHGLSLLRGRINKERSKVFPPFRSNAIFYIIEDTIDEILGDKLTKDEFFGDFISFKDFAIEPPVDINNCNSYNYQNIYHTPDTHNYISSAKFIKSHQIAENYLLSDTNRELNT